jgi:hypothetical protein
MMTWWRRESFDRKWGAIEGEGDRTVQLLTANGNYLLDYKVANISL